MFQDGVNPFDGGNEPDFSAILSPVETSATNAIASERYAKQSQALPPSMHRVLDVIAKYRPVQTNVVRPAYVPIRDAGGPGLDGAGTTRLDLSPSVPLEFFTAPQQLTLPGMVGDGNGKILGGGSQSIGGVVRTDVSPALADIRGLSPRPAIVLDGGPIEASNRFDEIQRNARNKLAPLEDILMP